MHSPSHSLIYRLKQHRQAFAFGIAGIHTLYNAGSDAGELLKPLETEIEDDSVQVGWYLPRPTMNQQLERVTENLLAAQLVVAVGDIVENETDLGWADSDLSEVRFLRLIRNGAAHDNRLMFTDDDPRSPVVWNGFEITEDMEGDVIFTQMKYPMVYSERAELVEGFFEAGDGLSMVNDIIEIVEERVSEPDSDEFNENKLKEWIFEAIISLGGASVDDISTVLEIRTRQIPEGRIQSELRDLEQQGRVKTDDEGDKRRYYVVAEGNPIDE